MKKIIYLTVILISAMCVSVYGLLLNFGILDRSSGDEGIVFGLSEEDMAVAQAVHEVENRFRSAGVSEYTIGSFDPESVQTPFGEMNSDTGNGTFAENKNSADKGTKKNSEEEEDDSEEDGSGKDKDSKKKGKKADQDDDIEEDGKDEQDEDREKAVDGDEDDKEDDHDRGDDEEDDIKDGDQDTEDSEREDDEENADNEEGEDDEPDQKDIDASIYDGHYVKSALDPMDASDSGPYGDFYNVEESYLTTGDTLLIGDSRQQGFGLYSGLDGMTVYADKGYAVYTVFTKKFIDVGAPFGKLTLPEALSLEPDRYKKIYIMFGINEMGWGSDELLAESYYKLIDMLKYYEPNAAIYVESILPVTQRKSSSGKTYRNERIIERNEILKEIAKNEYVAYLDLHSIYADENGALPSEYSADGIHLLSKYMPAWKSFLLTHAVLGTG